VNIPLAKRLGLSLFRVYRSLQTRIHELTYLFWECTLRCNLNCLHCGSDCQINSDTPDMPLDDFLKVLDEIRPLVNPNKTMIALTGGEPLLRKDLEACGREFYKRGFPWGMVTNGYALTGERLDSLLAAGLRSATVSLDGCSGSHDWLRGAKGSFERAMKAIEYCTGSDLVFDVVTCVNQRNFDEIGNLHDLLAEKRVKRWRLFTIFPKGRAASNPELRLTGDQFRRLMDFIAGARKKNILHVSCSCEGFLGAYEGEVRDNFFFCHAGVHIGSVLADGSISACPSLRGDFIQGSIYTDSFADCWNNRFKVMRNRNWTKTGICSNCKVYAWCNGNGLHLRNEKNGEVLLCHYNLLSDRSGRG